MAGETWKIIQERWRHHRLPMLGVALVATLIAGAAQWSGRLEGTEHIAYDEALIRYTGDRKASGQVVVVAIDQQSIDAISQDAQLQVNFGNWPYTRTLWARVAQELKAAGARAVLFDAVMDERASDESAEGPWRVRRGRSSRSAGAITGSRCWASRWWPRSSRGRPSGAAA
ncbi:CHASE2 domain-containing protein, partial [Corallococcus exercitus]|nr:CHASE2 domain-containing protein [Corallococcus exercitus]